MTEIKAIVFDVGGVLALDSPKHFTAELSIKKDIPVKDLVTIWRKYWADFKLGKITEDEFWTKFAGDLLIKEPIEDLVQECKDMIRLFLVPNDDVMAYVNSLKGKLKLGILSNNVKEWVTYKNDHFKIDEPFDAVVYSCDVGKVKPEKEIFELILQKLRTKAEETIFIDNHDRNIEAAQQIGMQTVLFENLDQMKQEVNKLTRGTEK